MNQLIRVTNAYSGDFTYIAQDKIVSFWAHTKLQPTQYKHEIGAWLRTLPGEESPLPIVESVEYLLARFPPL